jgi:hypothetical protein
LQGLDDRALTRNGRVEPELADRAANTFPASAHGIVDPL